MKANDRARELLFRLEYPHDETYTRRLLFIDKTITDAEAAMKERCAKLADDNDCSNVAEKIRALPS